MSQETIETLFNLYKKHPSVTTDTRKLKPGEIFFALNGPNFKGSDFVKEAFSKGAAWCVSDTPNDDFWNLVVVKDPLIALQQLALLHRNTFHIPFIAITGSNGKTTTKELIHAVLSTKYRTCTTEGNLNNHIGVPLTLLRIQPGTEMAVIEMGANHIGEIASYCEYTRPTHGLITNCGKAHLEGFGSLEGVRKGKGELFDYLSMHDGTAFINVDEFYLADMAEGIKERITYGTAGADFTARAVDNNGMMLVETRQGSIQTHLVGNFNLPNVLAAVAIGETFEIDFNSIKNAIESYLPSNSRSQLLKSGTNRIILDAYNANPSSMELAIKNLSSVEGKKILLIGGMKEMGTESKNEHQKIVDLLDQFQWDHVALVGEEFIGISGKYSFFPDSNEAGRWLKELDPSHSTILLKGSRGTRMENVLKFIGSELQ